MNLSGNLTALGATKAVQLLPGESATYTADCATGETFDGKAVLQRSRDGGQTWQTVETFDGTDAALDDTLNASGTVVNESTGREHYRFQVITATAADALAYTLADAVDVEQTVYTKRGAAALQIKDDGSVSFTAAAFATLALAWLASLPTADPLVAGAPWLDAGVLTVSAG